MSTERGRPIGIRELKTHASALVRRAAAGETLDISDRGRPVARLVPLRDDDGWWDRMVGAGELIAPRGDLTRTLAEHPAGPLLPGERSPVEALMELRSDER